MSYTGTIHLSAAIIALLLGPMIFFSRKATRWHIGLGWIYVATMLVLNISALFIYKLFGRFGVFHILVFVSLAPLTAGLIATRFKWPRNQWMVNHYRAMCWSYIGLVAAGVAESFVRIPWLRSIPIFGGWTGFGILVGGLSFLVCAIGGFLVSRLEKQVLLNLSPKPSKPEGKTGISL